MVDFNESSNVNLDEITKALEDMDSLDMELFNDSFKNSKSTTCIPKDFNMKSDEENKKKVIFKGSSEDDLFPVLLSDEEISVKEKKNIFASTSKSSLMEDLFKIKGPLTSTTSTTISKELDSKLNSEKEEANQLFSQKLIENHSSYLTPNYTSNTSCNERNFQKLKNVSRNEDDILVIDKSRRSSLKENLFDYKPDSSKKMDFTTSNSSKKLQSENTTPCTNIIQQSIPNSMDQSFTLLSRESRRGRMNSKIINDPLGLLPTDILSNQTLELATNENADLGLNKDFTTHNSKTENDLPEWLGGSKKFQNKQSEKQCVDVRKTDKVSVSKQNVETHYINNDISSKTFANHLEGASILPQQVSLLFGTQLNQQNALMNIQQQEHELKTATILSQQNDQLSKVSTAQHIMLHNQEEQFNGLLKLQIEKQALLEKHITMQQERINQYIQALMAQPISMPNNKTFYNSSKLELDKNVIESGKQGDKVENVIQKLEIENTKLESKLSTINKRHDSELIFQAEFYEKQISFLKEAIMKAEERVKQELECLETDYMTKFEKLRNEKLEMENQYKEEIHNLKNEHSQHIQEICKLHSENVQLLQHEYSNIIENISRAKLMEDQMIQNITSRKNDIEDILQKAQFIVHTIEESQKNLDIKRNEIWEFQENTLKVHETDIKALKHELKCQNIMSEEHRHKFIETTEKFEIRLTQLITELQKQSTLCNQTQETLEKKATCLLKEKELFEERMKQERDYMQILKESWIKEQEEQLKLLAKEKETIATEKAQLVVLKKLKSSNDEIAKAELEAAIKAVQEAAASASREKLRWQEKINALNARQQVLQDKENLLILHAKELENFTQSVLFKKEEGMKALKSAKHLENQNKEKFNQLQIQIQALMEREQNIATERYNINKSRMVSLAYEVEKVGRDTNVSQNFQDTILPFSNIRPKSEITPDLINIVDPNLIMLKLDLSNEFESINKFIMNS